MKNEIDESMCSGKLVPKGILQEFFFLICISNLICLCNTLLLINNGIFTYMSK